MQGSAVFSDRIGIGTLYPATRCHIIENSAAIPAIRVQNTGGGALIEALLGNSTAMILPGTHAGIGIGTSTVPIDTGLMVIGNARIGGDLGITGSFACSNIQATGALTANSLQIMGNVLKTGLKFSPSYGMIQTVESSAPLILSDQLSVNTISATTDYGRIRFRNASISVDAGTYLGSQPITLADQSIIFNQTRIQSQYAMDVVKQMTGYTYNLGASETCAGLVGNDLIQLGMTSIVSTMPDGKYGVRYDSLIPYLLESIKNLEARVRTLETK